MASTGLPGLPADGRVPAELVGGRGFASPGLACCLRGIVPRTDLVGFHLAGVDAQSAGKTITH